MTVHDTRDGRRKAARDIAGTVATRFALLPLTLASGVIIARVLGPSGRGVYATVVTVAELAVLLGALGVGKAVIYYIARERDPDGRYSGTAFWIGLFNGLLLSVALVAFALLLAPHALPGVPTTAMLLAAPWGILAMLRGVWEGELRGFQRNRAVNVIALVYSGSFLGLMAAVAFADELDPEAAVALRVVAATIAAAAACLWARSRARSGTPRFESSAARALIVFGIPYAVIGLAQNMNYRFDVLMIQGFLDNAQVGLYTVATSTVEMLWYLPMAVGFVLFPRVAGVSEDQAAREAAVLSRWTFAVVAGGAILLGLLAGSLITLVYGSAFSGSVTALRILLAGVAMNCWYQVLSGYLMGRRLLAGLVAATSAGVALNVGLNLVLLPTFGIEGAALASVVSYGVTAVSVVWLFWRATGTPVRDILIPRTGEVAAQAGRTLRVAAGALPGRRRTAEAAANRRP